MNLCTEMKLAGDEYAPGFSCGLSLGRSATIQGFSLREEGETCDRYENGKGLALLLHKEKDGDALRVWTQLENNGQETVTLEMLASFALKDVKADYIYRLQSFWSAEGKLRKESVVEDLFLETSWSGHGVRAERFGNVGSMPVRKYFPFLALEDSETGRVTAIQLYCAASWQMELSLRENDLLTVTGGLADRELGHWTRKVAPGETFTTPQAVIAEGASLYEACAKLLAAQHPQISPVDDHEEDLRPAGRQGHPVLCHRLRLVRPGGRLAPERGRLGREPGALPRRLEAGGRLHPLQGDDPRSLV